MYILAKFSQKIHIFTKILRFKEISINLLIFYEIPKFKVQNVKIIKIQSIKDIQSNTGKLLYTNQI